MAHGLGRTLRQAILNNLFNGGTLTAQSAWHISAHTGDPGPDGQTANEVGGGVGYSRVNYTGGWSSASAAEPSVVTNDADIVFPAASGAGWGTIQYAGIWNHATNTAAANFLAPGLLSPFQAVAAGNVMVIPAGTLSIQLGVTP
jgi:hypothetical protein